MQNMLLASTHHQTGFAWTGLRRLCAVALSLVLVLPMTAQAAGLQISNVLLEFQPKDTAQGLWLMNTGKTPLRAQARVQQWTQLDGEDMLSPTRVLAASPPMVEVAPGQQQFIRVVRLQPEVPAKEQAFRLLIDELPVDESTATGVQFLVRHAVPLFVLPQAGQALGGRRGITDQAALTVQLLPSLTTDAQLEVHNTGSQRVRISELVLVDTQDKKTVLIPGLLGYALAGEKMRWPLKLTAEQWRMGGKLTARLNDDPELQSIATIPAMP